jgi:uncharacterized repeat protein (TIGR04052 family)
MQVPWAQTQGALTLGATAISATDEAVVVEFAGMVGAETFGCSKSYSSIGTSKTSFKPLDFRVYLSDVALVKADGSEVKVALAQDQRWQRGGYALLDFEDGSGTCVGGTPETNTSIRGTAPKGEYVGLAFTVGIPDADNHLDAATAPAPLNAPGMWWSWSGGFKFFKLDVETPKNKSYYMHLGATKCTGNVVEGYKCASGNQPRIALKALDRSRERVALDVAALWTDVDLDAQIDGKTDFIPGCMSSATDPECPKVFEKFGLAMDGSALAAQAAFRSIAR